MSAEPQSCFLGVAAIIVSPEMRRTMELAERVARTSASVLIVGETGCGKEIVARAIHHYSLRCSKPWVDINCGALPEQLMESELFGHERGAFSGADTARPGLFEMAHTGTLFLDEVGELEPRMQVKLLRVLDGVPYYRVGGTKKVSVNTRILAATNQDLEQAVRSGQFRGDLYHRLNQYQLRVPPLRERREDIVPIAQYFLEQHSTQASFSKAAADLLRAWHWPGNVRELRNVVTTALIHSKDYVIAASDLGFSERVPGVGAGGSTDLSLDGMERDAIIEALRKTGGRCQQAADLLGISRRTLSRKLKQYGPSAREESCAYEDVSG
ncbi:MAG: sigma-54 dependent transcriptional regulator [Candidatus Solibacter sp.]|nr:sigma-54 dependent transcriptional regulator [Candidatus Solibacter sp.]